MEGFRGSPRGARASRGAILFPLSLCLLLQFRLVCSGTSNITTPAPVVTVPTTSITTLAPIVTSTDQQPLTTTPAPIVISTDQQPLAGTEYPSAAFPGGTGVETNAAFPRGFQPKSLSAWPHYVDSRPAPCWMIVKLRDFVTGWKGSCDGLTADSAQTDAAGCKDACAQDVLCSVWSFSILGGCWRGRAADCEAENSLSLEISGAQRLQHGGVTVLSEMRDVNITSLRFVGNFTSLPLNESIDACRSICYSDLLCQYWQYTASLGCAYEDPGVTVVPFPLTRNVAVSGSAVAVTDGSILGGEYIQHFCPPTPPGGKAGMEAMEHPISTTTAEPEDTGGSGLGNFFGFILFLLLLGGSAYGVYYYLHRGGKSARLPAVTRAVHKQPFIPEYGHDEQAPLEGLSAGGGPPDTSTYYTVWQDSSQLASGGEQQRLVHGSCFPNGDYQGALGLFEDQERSSAGSFAVMLIGPEFQELRFSGERNPNTMSDFRKWWEVNEHGGHTSYQPEQLEQPKEFEYAPLPQTAPSYAEAPPAAPLMQAQSHFNVPQLQAPNLGAPPGAPPPTFGSLPGAFGAAPGVLSTASSVAFPPTSMPYRAATMPPQMQSFQARRAPPQAFTTYR